MERKEADIESIEKILKVFDTIIVLLGLIGTAIAQYESNLYYENDNSPTSNSSSLRSIVSISTIILLVLISIHSKYDYQILKHKREALEEDVEEFFLSQNFRILVLELLLNLVHCPPGMDHTFVSEQLGPPSQCP